MGMNKKVFKILIVVGLVSLLAYYFIKPRSPTEMKLIAEWEFDSYMENEKIDTSIFVGPKLKYHKKEYVIFDWYVIYKDKDTLHFQAHIPKSNFRASKIVLLGNHETWNELLYEHHNKYLNNRLH